MNMKMVVAVALYTLLQSSVFARFLKSPYIQSLTDSSVVICWEQLAPTPGRIDYGLTPQLEFTKYDTSAVGLHLVHLSQLLSDTVYYYRIVTPTDTSPVCRFRTLSISRHALRLLVYGDSRTDSTAHQTVINRMLTLNPLPAILLSTGDLTENGSDSCYQIFFNITAGLICQTCLFPVLGNHDIRNIDNYFRFFVLPGNERYYSFRYGICIFIMLDNYSEIQPGSAQYEWLMQTLQSVQNDPAIRHKFIVFHEPPFTTNQAHPGNEQVQRYLCPLFEQFQVTAIFCGHIHAYEHSLVNGVHYFTTGGGGAPLHTQWYEPAPWTIYREAVYQFMVVDVNGDTVITCGVRTDGTGFDTTLIPRRQGINFPDIETHLQPELQVSSPGTGVIRMNLLSVTPAVISIYDLLGRKRAEFKYLSPTSGLNTITWHAPGPGCYFLILKTPAQTRYRRLTVF
ncbi:MAG: metallophosphoesterase [candidate division WOR-3 bacterium]